VYRRIIGAVPRSARNESSAGLASRSRPF